MAVPVGVAERGFVVLFSLFWGFLKGFKHFKLAVDRAGHSGIVDYIGRLA